MALTHEQRAMLDDIAESLNEQFRLACPCHGLPYLQCANYQPERPKVRVRLHHTGRNARPFRALSASWKRLTAS